MVGVTAESTLAFSLWLKGRNWCWSVYDLEGEVVASGAADTREAAEDAISQVYLDAAAGEAPAAA